MNAYCLQQQEFKLFGIEQLKISEKFLQETLLKYTGSTILIVIKQRWIWHDRNIRGKYEIGMWYFFKKKKKEGEFVNNIE